jgi:ABC-type multidrug transport system fused ATPase/permease subunit
MHSVRGILDLLSLKSQIDIEESSKAGMWGEIQGNIEFKNVTFKYPTHKFAIYKDLNFKIAAGQQIGMTGPSGSGKSTIFQLLLRFYDVDSGQILIDGIDIRDYDLKYLRKKIAWVSQEPVLFYGSVEDNLRYANTDVSEEEIKAAANVANVTSFIENPENESSEGSATPVSDSMKEYKNVHGKQLSGGQKQRVAIARAILRKPKIFLFDEATSALDTQKEAIVLGGLKEVTRGLTTITIAHRLNTIKEADSIMMLKDHVVVEQGTFKELIQKKGHFYQLSEEGHY